MCTVHTHASRIIFSLVLQASHRLLRVRVNVNDEKNLARARVTRSSKHNYIEIRIRMTYRRSKRFINRYTTKQSILGMSPKIGWLCRCRPGDFRCVSCGLLPGWSSDSSFSASTKLRLTTQYYFERSHLVRIMRCGLSGGAQMNMKIARWRCFRMAKQLTVNSLIALSIWWIRNRRFVRINLNLLNRGWYSLPVCFFETNMNTHYTYFVERNAPKLKKKYFICVLCV